MRPAPHLLLPCLLAACAATPPTRAEAAAVLTEQAAQWNRGDLAAFVDTYAPGPGLTFLGADGLTRGGDGLLARYRNAYPDAASRGRLSFEILDFRPLGNDHAVLLGRYELAREDPGSGYFTLVLCRTQEGLRILHDHTSATRR